MDGIVSHILDKITSYNIFNNLYPGVIFVYLLKHMTGIDLLTDGWIENLFIFYFIGMIMSRIGSIVIEPILQSISIINIKTKTKRKLLLYAKHNEYREASENMPIIPTLLEVGNTYRTVIATFTSLLVCKIIFTLNNVIASIGYDFLGRFYDWIALILLLILFLTSFVKQTDYIRKNVEYYMKKKQEGK